VIDKDRENKSLYINKPELLPTASKLIKVLAPESGFVTVSTDDATVFNMTLSEELQRIEQELGLQIFNGNKEVSPFYRAIQRNAIEAAFTSTSNKLRLKSDFEDYYQVINELAQILLKDGNG
jgi:hypothetical protein